jgi:hypothetical protein
MRAFIVAVIGLAAACAPAPAVSRSQDGALQARPASASAPAAPAPVISPPPVVPPPPVLAPSPVAPPPRVIPPPPVAARPGLAPSAVGAGDADACGASRFRYLIGKRKSDIPPTPPGARWRIACTTCMVTMDFAPARLDIFFEQDTGVIREVRCG